MWQIIYEIIGEISLKLEKFIFVALTQVHIEYFQVTVHI